MARRSRIVAALAALTLLAASTATALGAAAKPDSHDRALAAILDARVRTFQKIAAQTKSDSGVQKSLDKCPYIEKNPKQAFAALFALIPVLLIGVVNEDGPQLTALRDTLAGMHPDSPLFGQWLTAEASDLSLVLEFDNHGKKVDVCAAASVLLAKNTTAANVRRVLGIDPTLIAKLFTSPVASNLEKLNPKVRPFLIAAGVPRKDAGTLTSNN